MSANFPQETTPTTPRYRVIEKESTEYGRPKFGIVDQDGKDVTDLRLFHGTFKNFDKFEIKKDDLGIHLGSQEQADTRVFALGDQAGSQIIPVQVEIKNPLLLHDKAEWYLEDILRDLTHNYPDLLSSKETEMIIKNGKKVNIAKILAEKGYDAIVYQNLYEIPGHRDIKKGMTQIVEAIYSQDPQEKQAAKEQYKQIGQQLDFYRRGEGSSYSFIVFDPSKIKPVFKKS